MSIEQFYIDLIKSGEVVAFPTETVYGLGADAWNPSAVKKVFEIKGRPADNPLIVHLSSADQVRDFASEVPESAAKLIEYFWPGPLTLVLHKKPRVLDLISSGLPTVALRFPDHPIANEFISQTGPLVAPSANRSGRPSPTKAGHVLSDFGPDFPVIDGGATKVGLESTVLDLSGHRPVILRPGKIGKEELEEVLGLSVEAESVAPSPKSPGQKYSHYKPEAKVVYGKINAVKDSALYLVQSKEVKTTGNIISYRGDLEALSRELYDRFRQADIEGYEAVFVERIEPFKDEYPSLYAALMNRIEKAEG